MTTVQKDARVYCRMESPIGALTLTSDGERVTGLFMESHEAPARAAGGRSDPAHFGEACAELAAYFAGELRVFSIGFRATGTPFQTAVWDELTKIPFGTTVSYAAVARAIGRPAAVRAVGAANGRNPISIIVPCHRVIGVDGSLTGYGGGVERKAWLLRHEKEVSSGAGRAACDNAACSSLSLF